jgi:hypothetical protein
MGVAACIDFRIAFRESETAGINPSAWFTAAIRGALTMPGNQGGSASVHILRSSQSVDNRDIDEWWEATIA